MEGQEARQGDPGSQLSAQHRQEFSEGVAEDLAQVVAVDQTVQVPAGSLSGCLETRDWNALESGSVEYKYYCPGVGLVLETDQAGGQRNELTGVTGP